MRSIRKIKFLMMMGLACWIRGTGQDHLGTKTPYVPLSHRQAAAPAGYRPLFVNYVGRHGARFLTKAGEDVNVLQVLQAADKTNSLTAAGKQVQSMASVLREAGKGNYENITLLGKEEQEAIGERMRGEYGVAFRGGGLEVMTTYKVRTQQSAEAFLRAFDGYAGPRHFSRAPDSLDTVLRFYDLSTGYQRYKKSGTLKKSLDSLEEDARTVAVAARVCARIFVPAYVKKLTAGEAIAFTESLYDLYAISFSMRGELQQQGYTGSEEGLGLAFDRRDLEWLDFTNGAADFLEKGPGFDSLGIQVRVAVPLLVDFMNSTDRVVAGGVPDSAGAPGAFPDAILRFTHAEAIAPFAALLGIAGASGPVHSVFRYRVHWRPETVIPLSANIQWIIYAGPALPGQPGSGRPNDHGSPGTAKDYLIKILLNEKEAVLPLPTSTWPYYHWEDLKRYYIRKLGALHAGMQDNMQRYLAGLE